MNRGRGLNTRLLAVGVALWTAFYLVVAAVGGAGFDSHAYWLTRDGLEYGLAPGAHNAYLYSPAFAQAIRPLTMLPWHGFAAVWFAAAATTYLWLTRATDTRLRIVTLSLCLGDVIYGNVWWLFAITLSFGLRRPALWALPLLLKITPAVGVVWFAVRREWRNLAIVLLAAVAVVAISFAVDPQGWLDWLTFLGRRRTRSTFETVRLGAALLLTVYAARRDRPELLPAALWLAAPVFSINGLAVCAAVPYLLERRAPAREVIPTRWSPAAST